LAKNKSGIHTLAASVRVRYLSLPVPKNITINHISDGSFLKNSLSGRQEEALHQTCKQYRSSVIFWPSECPNGGQERVTLLRQYRLKMGGKTKQMTDPCHLTYREKTRSPAALATPVKK
jgi:hypothetical protein